MPTKALNDSFVKSVRVTTRQTFFDAHERGLGLRVTPSGVKTWVFVYRIAGKPSQWLTLGAYPTLTLAAARIQARDYRHDVGVTRIDPIAVQRAEREAAATPPEPPPPAFTFEDLAKLYATIAQRKKKTWRADVGKINRYLIPEWGSRPLKAITRPDVHALLDKIAAQGMTIGVNRIQALISRLFTIALDRSLIDAHPSARMEKRFTERAADRVLTDAELRALWTGLDAHPDRAADALRLRLLLGQRGDEIAGMAWSEVTLEERLWEIPRTRTKNKRPHAVPLAATALALLERRRAAAKDDEPRVFPDLMLSSDDYRALGTIHQGAYEWKDLRRTVATRLGALGFEDSTIGRVLNHAQHTVTAKHYNKHQYLAEKQQALDAWDRELQRILRNEPKTRAAVVSMRAARPRRPR